MSLVGWRPRRVSAALLVAVAAGSSSALSTDAASAAPVHWGISRDAFCPTATVADTNVLFGNGFGNVQGGCGGLDTSRGNRTTNPMFLNVAQRNLHLAAGSSAFDYAWASWSTWWDLDGEGRPQGTAADAGAYEDG